MGRCAVCKHPDREEIEIAVQHGGMSMREASKHFRIHRTQMRRHFASHVGFATGVTDKERLEIQKANEKAAEEWTPRAPESAGPIIPARRPAAEKVRNLGARVDRILEGAEIKGNADVALKAARELRQCTELEARLSGEARAAEIEVPGKAHLVIHLRTFGADAKDQDPQRVEIESEPPAIDAEYEELH